MNLKIERGLATRRQLVATATDLFATQGYEATSIDNVLDAAGVSRGALYHHFPGKEALFEAVLESVEEQLAAHVVAAAGAAAEPRLALQSGCLAWLERLRDPVVRRIVLVDAPAVVGWQRWREIDECHWFGLLKSALAEALPPSRLDATSLDVLAHMLLAALNELAFVIARAGDPDAAAQAGRAAVVDLLGRLLAE
ncbi:MAG TPA: TetR/AcrR family transcriptional regulator [Candidatus Dormibacteraeota bacterium]|nr:TetR/AcrR family transcriptional regulator [Candidatus Dormibacteraeota bacterium]